MPPPARAAVTVAPPTGTFAAFITMPTMVPRASAGIGVAESSARTMGAHSAIDVTDKTTLCTHFPIFIILTPLRHGWIAPYCQSLFEIAVSELFKISKAVLRGR